MIQFRLACLATLLFASTVMADKINPDLRQTLQDAKQDDVISVLIYLPQQVDTDGLSIQLSLQKSTMRRRHQVVVESLQDTANETQGDLLAHLATLKADGQVEDFARYWIVNGVRVRTTRDVIEDLTRRDDVKTIYLDYEIELIAPVKDNAAQNAGALGGGGGATTGTPEPGVVAVRAPEVWALGYTGAGVLVGSLDTGVDGNHLALRDRWAGAADPRYAGNPEWAWFDPVTNTTFPQAFGGHGTHTMGSVCGGAPGLEIGVAPGAFWMHAAVIDRVSIPRTISDAILAFQWMTDPDGDPNTNFDVPAVCSNSWGIADFHGVPDCDQTFWQFIDASEAAGTVQIFSAGNEGGGGLRRPADRASNDYDSFAVAAVDGNNPNWPIAGFSSRGPTNCTPNGTAAIKPDIAAPGVSVRSAWPGGSYQFLSGTSMASPHVNGVVALMREANPNIAVDDIKQIIYDTAFDLGSSGEDNSYGWGMVDAFEAVQAALGAGGTVCAENGTLVEGTDERNDFMATCGSDNVRWAAHGETFQYQISDPVVQFELTTTTANSQVGNISVDIEAGRQSGTAVLTLRALMYNFTTDQYVALPGTMALGTTDTTNNFPLPSGADAEDYIDPNTGEVRLLLQTIQTSGDPNVRTRIDEVLFNIQ